MIALAQTCLCQVGRHPESFRPEQNQQPEDARTVEKKALWAVPFPMPLLRCTELLGSAYRF